MNCPHLPYWLAAIYLPKVGPRTFMQWMMHFPDIYTLFHASAAELKAAGLSLKQIEALHHPAWQSVERDLAWADNALHHLITFEDADYPVLLKEISDPPLVLYVQGNKAALNQPQIAIIGSRRATLSGLKNAEQFAHCLVEAGLAITSGLAKGIDAASHQGAIAAKGVTIAVAGTGLHHVYPSSHKLLAERILEHQGAIISEFSLPTLPYPTNFPRRNRIISGLSTGVLVVEAAIQSGSLVTAKHALEQGREVFAIPGSIHHPLSRGCHHLLRQGAKLVETAADIIDELSMLRAVITSFSLPPKTPHVDDLPFTHQQVLAQIEYEITPLDVILSRSRLTTGDVSSILLTLELKGYVQSVSGGYVRIMMGK